MSYIYRLYQNGDEKMIMDLFELSFGRSMDPEYWIWRYKDNTVKRNYINLVIDEDVLAAHYALSPTNIYVDGRRLDAGLSMTTMTNPNYRGQRLFTKSAEDLYEKYKMDLSVIYGVPNANSIKGFTKYLDFEVIKALPVYVLAHSKFKFEQKNQCQEVERFDGQFDSLFERLKDKYRVVLSRDSNYLNWRFVDNPENDYKIHIYRENGRLQGYVVSKTFQDVCGDIVDVVALNPEVFYKLIGHASRALFELGVPEIKMWMNDPEYIKVLKRMGFDQSDEMYNFIVRSRDDEVKDIVMACHNWYLTMSDIDIF